MSEIYLTLEQCRDLGYCLHGVRRFCTRNGFNFRDLRDKKITAEQFEATGDALAIRLARHARNMHEGVRFTTGNVFRP